MNNAHNMELSRLQRLLEISFERAEKGNVYSVIPWSISFVDRTWDTYFELYYFKERVLIGNTSDKEFTIITQDAPLAEKVLRDFTAALPQYKLKNSWKESVPHE